MFAPNNTEPIATYPRTKSTEALIAWIDKTSDPGFVPEPFMRKKAALDSAISYIVSLMLNYGLYIAVPGLTFVALYQIYFFVMSVRKRKIANN
jgi:hypothetical protein